MKFQIAMLLSTVSLMTATPSSAADFPKQGETEYDSYYVSHTLAKLETAAGGLSGIEELTGITRNVKGEGPFHDMSVRCVDHWSLIGEKFNMSGSCVETDRDGDDVFTTFDNDAHTLVGGTGKYKGISGKASFTFVTLHDANGGRMANVVKHKVSWEMK